MDLKLRKLLLSTMHIVTCRNGFSGDINDETLRMAVTANENLHALGYTLRPADIWMLASSESLETFYQDIRELVPEMKANPMYPGFPHQVMKMSEAQFRFHQMMHYFSTYGAELITGRMVSKGWLPQTDAPQRTKPDDRLLEDKVLELADEKDAPVICVKRLFSRRERLSEPQLELVMLCLPSVPEEAFTDIQILFKENLELVFPAVFEKLSGKDAVRILHGLCAHTGDVLNNISLILKKNRYHLRTSGKRTLVQLLESYSEADFRGNLILSNAKRERNLMVLEHLDYNKYSRSTAHRKAVSDLRGKKLHSWESIAERKINAHEKDALEFLAKRPGIMLRKLNRLLFLGYEEQEISGYLCANAQKLSTQTLVRLLNVVRNSTQSEILRQRDRELNALEYRYEGQIQFLNDLRCFYDAQISRENAWLERSISEKKRILEEALRELLPEIIEERRDAQIKMRQEAILGTTFAISQGHAQRRKTLENSLQKLSGKISFLEKAVYSWRNDCEAMAHRRTCGVHLLERLEEDRKRILKQIAEQRLEEEAIQEAVFAESGWAEEAARIREEFDTLLKNAPAAAVKLREEHEAEIAEMEQAHLQKIEALECRYQKEQSTVSQRKEKLLKKKEQERELLLQSFEYRLRCFTNYPAIKRILMQALQAHFRSVDTVLRGKRIYLDDNGIDLKHSMMKAMDKSKDSTYASSGIAWRIPEEASIVRFFVYWNDRKRVDIDLHASAAAATDVPGQLSWFHVGWNSDFRNNGIVHSGDITHSDAAEYIDVRMDSPVQYVTMNIDLFSGRYSLRDVEECFTGLMAVSKDWERVRLYDPANCFFTHVLRQDVRFLHYGYINVKERYVRFTGIPDSRDFASALEADPAGTFYVQEYLDLLLQGQEAVLVGTPEEADLILSVGKSKEDGAVSLIDSNYFLDV